MSTSSWCRGAAVHSVVAVSDLRLHPQLDDPHLLIDDLLQSIVQLVRVLLVLGHARELPLRASAEILHIRLHQDGLGLTGAVLQDEGEVERTEEVVHVRTQAEGTRLGEREEETEISG